MKTLGTAAALVLLGAVGAHAQVVITDPAPVYVAPAPIYSPAPVVAHPKNTSADRSAVHRYQPQLINPVRRQCRQVGRAHQCSRSSVVLQ